MSVTVENVQKALQSVIDPNTGKDLITTKSAKNIKVDGSDVEDMANLRFLGIFMVILL